MALLARYHVSMTIVLTAAAAVGAVFAFARPAYERDRGGEMLDLAKVEHHSLAEVRAAFAKHGLPLRYDNAPSEPLLLSAQPLRGAADSLNVYFFARRTGTFSWGPKLDGVWDARLGNVLVAYGGHDEQLLARAKAAVDELD